MKHIILISLATVLIVSCQKDFHSTNDDYVEKVKTGLKDSLSIADFQALDFSKAARSRVDTANLFFLRVPFTGKKQNEDFVMVQTNAAGVIGRGKIIHLEGKIEEYGIGNLKRKSWNGTISLVTLDRKLQIQSPIQNGYVTAFHQQVRNRTASHEPEGNILPEVIITYTKSSNGGSTSWTPWFQLQVPDWGASGGGGGGYYGDFSGGGSSGGSGGGYSAGSDGSGGSATTDPIIFVDTEYQDRHQAIDIKKYVACFNSVPDAGATCSIEISTDIPVDANPNVFFDFTTGSPGHVFITVSKTNGTQYVSQNIGFYPKSGYKAMTYAPTAGKLVDNAKHEFNASLSMSLTLDQLSTVLIRMQQLSNLNYDVDSYNCTDWALDIFNSVRTNRLQIPLYGIPNSHMPQGSQTPQGLYHKLQQMMNSNHPEKANITIGIVKGYAGGSTGPCN